MVKIYKKFLLWLYRQKKIWKSIWAWWIHRNFLNRWGNCQDHLSPASKHPFCIRRVSQRMWICGHQRPQSCQVYSEKGNKGGKKICMCGSHPPHRWSLRNEPVANNIFSRWDKCIPKQPQHRQITVITTVSAESRFFWGTSEGRTEGTWSGLCSVCLCTKGKLGWDGTHNLAGYKQGSRPGPTGC